MSLNLQNIFKAPCMSLPQLFVQMTHTRGLKTIVFELKEENSLCENLSWKSPSYKFIS